MASNIDQSPKRMLDELAKIQADDRSLVLVTNGYLELLIEILVEARCKNGKKIIGDSRTYPYAAKLILLHEIGVLDDQFFGHLERFRKLRNRAAHEPFFEVTEQERTFLRQDKSGQASLGYHCFSLFSGLWNSHAALFTPRFPPNPKHA